MQHNNAGALIENKGEDKTGGFIFKAGVMDPMTLLCYNYIASFFSKSQWKMIIFPPKVAKWQCHWLRSP